ncbi:uncharacterized protein LOC109607312 [Aethina tumida]|uniref:uncharacterized protein LOC109607312 n=1 Tax=Aethina tumida TaxID=116153 RepID=UPI00096B1474|nr:uncharacterized protein LOC109607312 [Aethina tumida]
MVVFCSPTVVEEIRRLGEVNLHMDGTFSVVPHIGDAHQLFIIHLRYRRTIFPILYVLMERRDRAAYNIILRYLKEEVFEREIVVGSIMADYERALRLAIMDTYPGTRIVGCWFHYAKAVYLRGRQLGLVGHLNVPNNIGQGVRMAMVLPLLPQDNFAAGIEEVEAWMRNGVQGQEQMITAFVTYLRRQWTRANVSVFGEEMRTNNSVESFHNSLVRMIGRKHPNIWVFVTHLLNMENAKASDLVRMTRGLQEPNTPRARYTRLNRRIGI